MIFISRNFLFVRILVDENETACVCERTRKFNNKICNTKFTENTSKESITSNCKRIMGIPVEQIPPSYMGDDDDDDVSLRLPCPNDSQQPLTVFVRHHVSRTKPSEFIHWCNEINAIARTYDGFISTEVIKPVCYDGNGTIVNTSDTHNSDVTKDTSNSSRRGSCSSNFHPTRIISDEYISIVRFQNYTLLKRWIDSDDRKRMLRRTNEFSNVPSTYSYHSLEHWFPSNINGTNPTASSTGTDSSPKPGPPPKWKMTIFVTIIIYLQTLWIPKVTGAMFPSTNNNNNVKIYAMGLLNTFLVVALVTYILFPITTRLMAFWLFPHEKYSDKLKELIPKTNVLCSGAMPKFFRNIDRPPIPSSSLSIK